MINLYTLDLFNDSLDQKLLLELLIAPRLAYPVPVSSDYPKGKIGGTFWNMYWHKRETGKSGLFEIIRKYSKGDTCN